MMAEQTQQERKTGKRTKKRVWLAVTHRNHKS